MASASLLLLSAFAAFGQDTPDLVSSDKAAPEVNDALRARVDKFYGAFIAGKFKDAYVLVADESQNKFFEMDKVQYKSCAIDKIGYTDNFTKAEVVTICKSEWRWHGAVLPATIPITSNWKIEDGQWCWYYVKPTRVPSPFSSTGFVLVPPESQGTENTSIVPPDIAGRAQAILAKVTVDKREVRLPTYQSSQDSIHVRNDMPGSVSLRIDKLDVPGLKITMGKTDLREHEETTILFEWRLDDPAILCADCAKKLSGNPVIQLHILPTAQTFPIRIFFDNRPNGPQPPTPPQASQPQAPQQPQK
ncbi:MAG: hypothetical protein ACLPWF_23285 [Bryobacteraceae bacterium]